MLETKNSIENLTSIETEISTESSTSCYVAARIERRESRGATAADVLQYSRRYSTAGTVHGYGCEGERERESRPRGVCPRPGKREGIFF